MSKTSGDIVTAYTTTQHLLLDLDSTSNFQARGLALVLCKHWPDLGNCLVVQCGSQSHHLIFDNILPFQMLSNYIHALWDLSIVNPEVVYFRQQRGDFSLRVSPKLTVDEDKKVPIPTHLIINDIVARQSRMIDEYLKLLAIFNPKIEFFAELPYLLCSLVYRKSYRLCLYQILGFE